ncbi:MAG: FadR family transcriptional regulator [Spirochaetaceae bacterium]|nr:FadR family transcriptional regulator [Spirochaetaceae bacterium]MCF7949040.1 FadR family transcriptional regulator [Spirochaetia bacterium]MCF7951056.1 FadR family transcriptional regulator [Spirochaetaceae bacterium]
MSSENHEKSGLEPVKKIRLYESIVKQIQHLINEGELVPGQKLPPERELAEELNVSRTSIREALRALEMMGYLESKVGVGGGTFIKEITIDNIISPFSKVLLKNDDYIVELLEVRLFLEIESARLAALRRNEEELQSMQAAIDQMEQDIKNGGSGLDGDNNFHRAISVAANNRVLQQFVNMCGDLLEVEREAHLTNNSAESERALGQHKKLIQAIREKDDERAQKIMRSHILNISKLIKSNRLNPDSQ